MLKTTEAALRATFISLFEKVRPSFLKIEGALLANLLQPEVLDSNSPRTFIRRIGGQKSPVASLSFRGLGIAFSTI
jgi:hypothetical protein